MIGAVLADRYRIDAELARGGMGAVYRGLDVRLSRPVAIKVLLPALTEDLDAIERFQREGLATARLNHPGIVQILDVGSAPDPAGRGRVSFLVMELVDGISLATLMSRGPLAVPRAVEIGVQLLGALAAAHAAGITHRDLKPANVMIVGTPDGERVKVVDFGLAQVKSGTAHTRLTQTGQILGTPLYMSPEQARAQPCDARTDVYAVGLILWSCLTGRVPYSGRDMASVILSVIEEVPAPLDVAAPGVPPALAAVIARAIEKAPERRFESAQAFAAALRASEHTSVAVRATAEPRPRGSRWPWIVALLGAGAGALGLALILALGGLTWIGLAYSPPERSAAPTARREVLTREIALPAASDASLGSAPTEPRAPHAEVAREHERAPHVGSHAAAPAPQTVSPEAASAEVAPDASAEPAAAGAVETSATVPAASGAQSQLCEIASRCCERIGAPYEACRDRMAREDDVSCRQIIRGYRTALERQGIEPGPCREP